VIDAADIQPPPGKGVKFVAPPAHMRADLLERLDSFTDVLPDGARGALVGIGTTAGGNVAVIAKLPKGWAVEAWIGSKWTDLDIDAGFNVLKVF
jgi:hypothetical protein